MLYVNNNGLKFRKALPDSLVQWYLLFLFLSWTWLPLSCLRHTEYLLSYPFFSIFSYYMNLDINDEGIDVWKQSKPQREFMLHKTFHTLFTKFRSILSNIKWWAVEKRQWYMENIYVLHSDEWGISLTIGPTSPFSPFSPGGPGRP